jgi:signal transduction histidine kinase
MLVAERDRIARDLHDVVIQRIFATGLQLQGVRKRIHDEEVAAMLSTALTDLDTTIRDIRSTIFELQHTRKVSLRGDVRALVKEYVPVLGFTPLVRTTGPVDSLVPANIAGQLLAVLREGLSNVVKHADADACMVEVDVVEDRVVLKVIDNGRGLGPDVVESGLRNARRRAIDLGGTLTHSDEEVQGTRLEWQVPFTH